MAKTKINPAVDAAAELECAFSEAERIAWEWLPDEYGRDEYENSLKDARKRFDEALKDLKGMVEA